MLPRERVRRAIDFERPDRVPYFAILPWHSDLFPMFPTTPRTWQPPEGFYPYMQPLEITTGAWKSKRKLPRGWLKTKHVAIDEWGVTWERHGAVTTLGQVLGEPIKTWEDLDTYQFPDPRDPERYRIMTALSKVLGRRKYKMGSIGNFFFERYHFLRGWEGTMRDLIRPSPRTTELLDRLLDFYLAMVDEWIARGVDGIICTDDLGAQAEPLMSPATYTRFFLPRVKQVFDHCHDHGVHVMMHSCGDIKLLMPLLVDAGLDVFQFDGPDQTGVAWCGEQFGGKVAFMNVVDIQNVLPAAKGVPSDIETYVKDMIYHLGSKNGGLIGLEYPTSSVLKPHPKAYQIMRRAFRKHGCYPLDMEALRARP